MPKKKQELELPEELPKEFTALPTYRFEVMVGECYSKVDVYAQMAHEDGDQLNFVNIIYIDDEEIEDPVAMFNTWVYFTRKESDQQRAAELWGKEFEQRGIYSKEDWENIEKSASALRKKIDPTPN